jgi:outer membrane protein TolC
LAADAFTNPEYLRYALKGALAVVICYLAQSAVNWPGIRTCLITCMIVGLTSEGATIQKGTLRIAGAIVGGVLGSLAILVVVPNMESIASLALLVATGAAISAWVFVGSPRISYAGVQIALAFYICVIQGFEPTWYFYTIRDRMIGILLGNAVITLVFVSVWPVRAGDAAWTGLASALRAMADLARVGGRSEDQAVVARTIERLRAVVARHFAAARQSAEEESFEWVAQEEGESNRDRFRIAEEEARAVFVMQLAVANQRPNVLPSDLPDTLVAATRQFDALVAESLEASAQRSQQSATRALPDLRGPLEGLTTIAHAEMARTADPEMAHQLDGRLASYRELIPRLERLGSAVLSRGLTRLAPLLLAGCMAYAPLANAPPSADRAWRGPDLQRVSTELGAERHSEVPERATIDAQKAYELDELIDLAQRTNPETRVAWEKVRQAALATGIAEATYYPKLAAAATAAIASVPLPIPETVVPGGVFRSKTQFAIPALSLEWLLLDFGRRGATVDAARALTAEANAGFNAKHQEVVFGVTREFYALTAARGKLNASQAAYDSARTLAEAVAARKERGLATRPEFLQAEEAAAKAAYDLEDATTAETDARMALLETVGIGPSTPIEIADVSQRPLPPELSESVDGAVDRALAQRPDLIALLAEVQAKRAAVRGARADYWPRLAARGEYGGNFGELAIDHGSYQSVSEYQYTVGMRFEWDLFEGFARRNKVNLAQSQQRAAESELAHAREKTVRQVWKAYNDAKVALAKERAASALLAASEKSWSATLESYQHGLATFPDVRDSERSLAQARALDQAARAEAWTRAAAFAVSTGDLAQP